MFQLNFLQNVYLKDFVFLPRSSFLLKYVGERITPKEADEREKRKKNGHCYVYHFKWNGMRW